LVGSNALIFEVENVLA